MKMVDNQAFIAQSKEQSFYILPRIANRHGIDSRGDGQGKKPCREKSLDENSMNLLNRLNSNSK